MSAAHGRYLSVARELMQRRSTTPSLRLPGGLEQGYMGQLELAWSLMTERERALEEARNNAPENLR